MNAHLLATRIFDNAEPVVREQILADIEPLVVERVKRSVDEEVQERGVEVSTRLREIEEEEEHHEDPIGGTEPDANDANELTSICPFLPGSYLANQYKASSPATRRLVCRAVKIGIRFGGSNTAKYFPKTDGFDADEQAAWDAIKLIMPTLTRTTLTAFSQARIKPGIPFSQSVIMWTYLLTAMTGEDVADEVLALAKLEEAKVENAIKARVGRMGHKNK